jgi:hypothetical protein
MYKNMDMGIKLYKLIVLVALANMYIIESPDKALALLSPKEKLRSTTQNTQKH